MKKKTRDERLAELARTDEKFRGLYDKVVELNGGRVPSSKEIDQRIEDWRARQPESS